MQNYHLLKCGNFQVVRENQRHLPTSSNGIRFEVAFYVFYHLYAFVIPDSNTKTNAQ